MKSKICSDVPYRFYNDKYEQVQKGSAHTCKSSMYCFARHKILYTIKRSTFC